VREIEDGLVEVAAVNPMASMQAVDNSQLGAIAQEITAKLENVMDSL
jgi:hypothetical protein